MNEGLGDVHLIIGFNQAGKANDLVNDSDGVNLVDCLFNLASNLVTLYVSLIIF